MKQLHTYYNFTHTKQFNTMKTHTRLIRSPLGKIEVYNTGRHKGQHRLIHFTMKNHRTAFIYRAI